MAKYNFKKCIFEINNNNGRLIFKPLTNINKFRLSFLVEHIKFNIIKFFKS